MSCDSETPSTRTEAIKKKLASVTPIDRGRCMYKVHERLRDVNEKAYKPMLLAIGPFNHHCKVGEGFMEEHKLLYLQQLLTRTKASVEKYITTLSEWEEIETARKCYVECNVEKDEFVEMMLLDGCFIIELFRKFEIYWTTDEDYENDLIFQMQWVRYSVARDLLLFENQLPFFVLSKLFKMTESNGSRNSEAHILDIEEKEGNIHESSTFTAQNIPTRLNDLALFFFSKFVPFEWNIDASSYNSIEKIKDLLSLMQKALNPSLPSLVHRRLEIGFKFKNAEFEHLLGLIHTTICISILDTEIDHAQKHQEESIRKANSETSESQKSEVEDNWDLILLGKDLLEVGVEYNTTEKFKEDLYKNYVRWLPIPNGFELLEAGIEFDKARKFKDLFDLHRRNKDRCKRGLQMDGVKLKGGEKFLHMLCLNNIENWKSIPYGEELREAGIEFNKAKKFKRLHEVESWNIHGAAELHKAGIEFKKVDNCFSIMFNDGILKVSPLTIEDSTEAYLRNLIAYEQYCGTGKDIFNCVYMYVDFMDTLINTPKDVELLRRRGIIDNCLGDDEIISSMVNKLGHNIVFTRSDSIYARTCKEVNMHCRRRKNVWMATLRRDYFNTPWALVSFLGVVLLLGLSIVQTIFSIIR